LANVHDYYGQNTAIRIAKGVLITTKEVESWSLEFISKEKEVDQLVCLAEAEKLETVAENVHELPTIQLDQKRRLQQRDKDVTRVLQEL
jgi:hypothetical protein